MHELSFEKLVTYDAGRPGISLDVELRLGHDAVAVEAKIDTGASYCIFERGAGERLGLDIESGRRENISTVTGTFAVFAHAITLSAEGFDIDTEVYIAEEVSFRRNVLGRLGWLDQVVLAINDYGGKLFLSRHE